MFARTWFIVASLNPAVTGVLAGRADTADTEKASRRARRRYQVIITGRIAGTHEATGVHCA